MIANVRVRPIERSRAPQGERDSFEREADRAASGLESGATMLHSAHASEQGERIVPALRTPLGAGRALEPATRAEMGSLFGFDFSSVRIHDDATAAETNARMRSNAYTMGTHVAFGRARYRPDTAAGRRLIAHELAHVLQQSRHTSVQLEGADGLPGGGVLTTSWDIQFQLNHPAPQEMNAAPSAVLTESGVSSLGLVRSAFQMNPMLDAELEGNASLEGPPDYNQALSARRARYIAGLIGVGRARDLPGGEHMCARIEGGVYACGTSHAHAKVDPADRRVHVAMFVPPAPMKRSFSGAQQESPATPPATAGGTTAEKKDDDSPNQLSASAGIGYTGHKFLSTPGATDKANEAVVQIVAAYTRQLHPSGKSGLELQTPVQLQVSLTTGAVSLAGGVQLSYVIPFHHEQWQWSAFGQVLGGGAFGSGSSSAQFQPSLGTQITFQPKKWLQLSAQISGGGTVQSSGPNSLDFGGVFVIQFVH